MKPLSERNPIAVAIVGLVLLGLLAFAVFDSANLPIKMSQIARLASYGSWLNFFMCNAAVSGVKEQFGPSPTGVAVTAARCKG